MRKSVEKNCLSLLSLIGGWTSLLKVPHLVLFWLKETWLRILKDWSGDSRSLRDLTKQQMSLSSSSIDNGRRLSIISLDL